MASALKSLVSIITPSFNQGQFIEETIQSVLSQEYENLEYIVIDGGSTDHTLAVLRKYEGKLHWISESDRGQSHAINKGFRMAKGEIVGWLNSDDTFVPGAISKAVDYLEQHPDVMMVYGEGYLMDEKGNLKGRFPATEPFNLWRLIYYGDYILQQTVFIRKKIFDEIPMLDESLHYGMDWDLWIRIGKRFKIAYIPEYLGNLREYATAKTFSGGMKRLEELVCIMRMHGDRRFPPAFFNYGWDPYVEQFLVKFRRRFPQANWRWLEELGVFSGKVVRNVIFKRVTRLSQPSPFPDGWVSDKSYFLFPEWRDKHNLRVVGSTYQVPDQALPLKIKVRINGKLVEQRKVKRTNHFEIDHPLSEEFLGAHLLEVCLTTNKHFIPSHFGSKDHRRLAFQLQEISLV